MRMLIGAFLLGLGLLTLGATLRSESEKDLASQAKATAAAQQRARAATAADLDMSATKKADRDDAADHREELAPWWSNGRPLTDF